MICDRDQAVSDSLEHYCRVTHPLIAEMICRVSCVVIINVQHQRCLKKKPEWLAMNHSLLSLHFSGKNKLCINTGLTISHKRWSLLQFTLWTLLRGAEHWIKIFYSLSCTSRKQLYSSCHPPLSKVYTARLSLSETKDNSSSRKRDVTLEDIGNGKSVTSTRFHWVMFKERIAVTTNICLRKWLSEAIWRDFTWGWGRDTKSISLCSSILTYQHWSTACPWSYSGSIWDLCLCLTVRLPVFLTYDKRFSPRRVIFHLRRPKLCIVHVNVLCFCCYSGS